MNRDFDGADTQLAENVRPPDWRNPELRGSYDLIVIGGGPAGYNAAVGAVQAGKSILLVERKSLGGASLNFGAIPSKALLHTARWYGDLRDGKNFGGLVPGETKPDFQLAMARMKWIRARLSKPFAAARLQELGVDVFFGDATFGGPTNAMIDGKAVQFERAVIATGAAAKQLEIPGLDPGRCHTVRTCFDLVDCPERLLIIGAYGFELAQIFQMLGAQVILVQQDPKFLSFIERDAAQIMARALARFGTEIHLDTIVRSVREEGRNIVAELANIRSYTVEATDILVGDLPLPRVQGLGLESAGVAFDEVAGVQVNDHLQTTNERIYAAGDVCSKFKFTHIAEAHGRLAVNNALTDKKKKNVSELVIPLAAYTNPGIAHVGMLIQDARDKSIPIRTITVLLHDVDRAVIDGEEEGFLKIHIRDGTDEILGATAVSRQAGELISGLAAAISFKVGLSSFSELIAAYPMLGEAVRKAAEMFEVTKRNGRLEQNVPANPEIANA